MNESSDFLVRYDHARSEEERDDMLADEFAQPKIRKLFRRIVHDLMVRSMFELGLNGSIRFEDFAPLRRAGLVTEVMAFYPRISYGPYNLDPIPYVVKTALGRRWLPEDLRDTPINPLSLIGPYIHHYLWRSTKGGIVASSNPLADAVNIPDVEVLRLIRDPLTGERYLPDDNPDAWEAMLQLPPPRDIHAARESQLKWWRSQGCGTQLHDMSGYPPALIADQKSNVVNKKTISNN